MAPVAAPASISIQSELLRLHKLIISDRVLSTLSEQCRQLNGAINGVISEISSREREETAALNTSQQWLDYLIQHLRGRNAQIAAKLSDVTSRRHLVDEHLLHINLSSVELDRIPIDQEQSPARAQEVFGDLCFRFETRRAKLLYALQSLYPIGVPTLHSSYYSIRDIQIPSSDAHGGVDDDTMSAALGYICHLIIMVAKYLSVSLRYRIHYRCSRSVISDEISPIQGQGSTEYPLYRTRGVERAMFECGIILLNRLVDQILRSRDVDASASQIRLENPVRLLVNLSRLFRMELP